MLIRRSKNIELKIACVAIAVALWFYAWQSDRGKVLALSGSSEAPKQWYVNSLKIEDIPVIITGGDTPLSLERNKVSINVKVEASISIDSLKEIRAELKASRINDGDSYVELLDTDFVLPEGVVLIFFEPRKIKLIKPRT